MGKKKIVKPKKVKVIGCKKCAELNVCIGNLRHEIEGLKKYINAAKQPAPVVKSKRDNFSRKNDR